MVKFYLVGVALFITAVFLVCQDDMEEDNTVFSALIIGAILWPLVFIFLLFCVILFFIKQAITKVDNSDGE